MVKPQDERRLVSLSMQQFVKSVGARTAAPGGGSVSAAVAAMVRKCVSTGAPVAPKMCWMILLWSRGQH